MTESTKKTVLYIDGQNFTTRIRSILRRRGVTEIDLAKFDFWGLLGKIFKNEQVDLVQIYFAKLHAHKDTAEKSEELLKRELELKALLEKQGIKYITAGSVRPRKRGDEIEFVEKGVDIRIAVDMVTDVIDGVVGTVLLASSDSDMQPAIYEIKHRGAEVCYVGFASRMNRGLMLTTDRYVLIDNDDIAEFYGGGQAQQAPGDTPQTRLVAKLAENEPVVQLRNQRRTVISAEPSTSHRYGSGPRSTPPTHPTRPVVTQPPAPPAKEETEFNVPPWTRTNI